MKSKLSVTSERVIPVPPAAVWSVIANPVMQAQLDERYRLESATGNGEPGSEFVLVVRTGVAETRLRYVVRDVKAEARWIAEVYVGDEMTGLQSGELADRGGKTLLRWTVSVWTGRLARRRAAAACTRELESWLESVEREALLVA